MKNSLIISLWLLLSVCLYGQDRFTGIENSLNELSATQEGLNNSVELSVSNTNLSDFVRGVGLENKLNVSIDPSINYLVNNNFSNALVKDIFLFLCRQYKLDIDFVGSIISFKKYVEPKVEEIIVKKKPKVNFNKQNDFISLDLKRDTIDDVVQEITSQSLHNVIIEPEVTGKKVSVYIQNRPFENALDKMALANGLKLTKTADNFYVLGLNNELTESKAANSRKNPRGNNKSAADGNLAVEIKDQRFITLKADQVPVNQIIDRVSQDMLENYFMYDVPTTPTSVFIENASYEEFLGYILKGTGHVHGIQDDVYLIGKQESDVFRSSQLLKFENRRVETILESIPNDVKKGLQITEFLELNGLILSGSVQAIGEFEEFAKLLDVVVPVVTIDIIVAEVTDTRTLSTGIYAGLGGENVPSSTTGSISDGTGGTGTQFDLNLSTGAINDIISGVNGAGLVNLGNVSPDFYLRIRALEENGDVKVETTPSIATLNGHESQIKIGEQVYYAENNNNILNTGVNQTIANSQVYKSVNADFSIKIVPFVSEDEQVTLNIEFEQSSFSPSTVEGAPPGKVTRSFNSLIRVKNGDMILLGGLGEKINDKSSEGLPLLSRIPVLKWFFGKNTRQKTKKQLTVFIRPTITY